MNMATIDDTRAATIDDDVRHGDAPVQKIVEVRDGNNRLLLRFDPDSHTATICLSGAEFALRTVDGVIEMSSSSPIRIRSLQTVELVAAPAGADVAANRLAVSADAVDVVANMLRVAATHTDFVGRMLTARAESVKMTWEKCERIVGRTFEYARHAYQRVEVLLHIRAGRIRTESKGAHLLQARAVRMQADEDVRVQAKAINLG